VVLNQAIMVKPWAVNSTISIDRYGAKRDFNVTLEPRGGNRPANHKPIFVVQKHQADRAGLHWDFRLEHGGVLWSWAVPKGPSLDPADKRLAIHVEDHPIDYADFQGAIPVGYGAGQVETWDKGVWAPLGDADEDMRRGELRFMLAGRRLNGRFTLARLKRRQPSKQDAWFLIKGHDEEARDGMAARAIEKLEAVSAAFRPKAPAKKPATIVSPAPPATEVRIVTARAPKRPSVTIGDVEISHADRQLWPGITKRGLAEYWVAVADHALPILAHRPLAVLRAPDGVDKEQFFQKHAHGHMPPQIREGSTAGAPYLAIDDANGLVAMAQMSAIELHPWGASERDPTHPDRLVLDLDPGEGVTFERVIAGAHDVRDRLKRLGLISFCRTSGGKGLHVVVPLHPRADWDAARSFCRALAELMSADRPDRYVAHVKIADRRGRILIDWLRNGLGSTAIGSFCPRARSGAIVATPLAWTEVKAGLNPAAYTILTVPDRLRRQRNDPWKGFAESTQELPLLSGPAGGLSPSSRLQRPPPQDAASPVIVVARKPKRR